jgi:hypothetical protein
MSLRKGTTFNARHHHDESPVEQARYMPRRSQTCTKTLEDLLPQEANTGNSRHDSVAKLLRDFDDQISGRKTINGDGSILKEADVLAVPTFMVNQGIVPDPMDIDQKALVSDHQHASDSGLGSSVASSIGIVAPNNNKTGHLTITDLYKEHNTRSSTRTAQSISTAHSTVTRSASAIGAGYPRAEQLLSKEAERHIRTHIIKPILDEETLRDFHPLVEDIPRRIGAKFISNLRDLEKTLFFLAPVSDEIQGSIRAVAHALRDIKDFAPSPQSFLKFCETTIECLHTTVDLVSERDQRRDTDRPYTNHYFLDLVEQIRRYADIMARTREKQASGQELDEMDYSPYVIPVSPSPLVHAVSESLMCLSHPTLHKLPTCHPPTRMLLPNTYLLDASDETIALEGGLSKNGKPAELVRKTKDGKVIPLSEHSLIDEASPSSKRHYVDEDDMDDDDVLRSMARRRKSEKPGDVMHPCRVCDKEFKRPCDLTKHEKTHSRPWKCSEPKCKYHEYGWPTEKERDRHVNDKHNSAPQMYHCKFKPCSYSSKRESNCKQHMEKAHGWTYVRSKSNGRTKLGGGSENLSPVAPLTPFMATPSSGMNNLTSPESNFMPSPAMPAANFNFNTNFNYTPGPPSSEDLFDFNTGFRRESVATTNSAMTFSSGSNFSPAQHMNSAFEEALSPELNFVDQPLFGLDGMPADFTMPVQQPTPAASINSGYDNSFAGLQGNHLSPTGQANMTLFTPQMENTHFDEALGNEMNFGADFTLFDTTSPAQTNMMPAATNQWYPDMGTIGGQFGDFGFTNTNNSGFDDIFGGQH